jgi:uncharacterized protein (TIGR02246 family)
VCLVDDLRNTIETLSQAMTEAFKRGDVRELAQFYADDGMVIGPHGQRFRGRAAIADYWASFVTIKDWCLEMLELDGDGNIIYQVARSKITHDIGGKEMVGSVDVVLIWKRQRDNTYRICVDSYL